MRSSGVCSGFAALAGLLLVPRMIDDPVHNIPRGEGVLSHSTGWILAGLVIGILFVAVVGPGVRFAELALAADERSEESLLLTVRQSSRLVRITRSGRRRAGYEKGT